MALRLLLQVSWICFLLFDGSAALPAIKGYGYPSTADSRNIGDDEDEVLTSLTFDESNWGASNNQPTGPAYTSYNKPTIARQPVWVSSPQNLPYTPTAPELEKPVNGAPKDSGLEKPDQLLLLGLNDPPSDPAKPQPGPVQPQSTSLGVASTNSMPASPSASGLTYSSPTAYEPALSSTSQAAKSPSFDTWQPAAVASDYYAHADFNAGGGSRETPHLVYEDVFQYPSENTEPSRRYAAISNNAGGYGQADYMSKGSSTRRAPTLPSYPTDVRAQPMPVSGIGGASSGISRGVTLNSGQMDYQPRDSSWGLQKPVASTQEVEVSQRVSEPIYPSYFFQSRNGYRQGRHLFSQMRYTPEYPAPMPVSSLGVKGPAPTQPAAPKGVKNPQRTKW